jgi:drug/metabolite transporter (DMT)-like permease
MWLLPWEKLPALILGPLMIVVGVFVFLVPDVHDPAKRGDSLPWGVGYVVVGAAVTAYGIWKQVKKTDGDSS